MYASRVRAFWRIEKSSASKKSFEIGIRGVDPDIAPDFSTVHYEFALGIAIRNLIAGSATPQWPRLSMMPHPPQAKAYKVKNYTNHAGG